MLGVRWVTLPWLRAGDIGRPRPTLMAMASSAFSQLSDPFHGAQGSAHGMRCLGSQIALAPAWSCGVQAFP
jgi:hypothetical protein